MFNKKPLIPILIIALLLGLYSTRWKHETTFKPIETAQVSYKVDRWTGDRWITIYTPTDADRAGEGPAVRDPAKKIDVRWWRDALSYTWYILFSLSVLWFGSLIYRKRSEG